MNNKIKPIKYIAITVFVFIYLFPVYWMLSTSLKTNDIIMKLPPQWFPQKPTISNFLSILSDIRFLTFYKNTVFVATCATVLSLILAVFASYSFSRFKFPGSKIVQMVFLSTQMFPAVVLLIALYSLYKSLHLLNTYSALILACSTNALPLSIWVLKGFYDTIPVTLEEAAYIDGCSKLRTLFQIIVPLIKPGLIAVSIYAFLVSWDDFLWSLTLVNKVQLRTLTAGIALTYLGENSYDWAKVMTASVSASIPILVVFIFLQKYMISGLTAGAVKG